MSFNYAPLASTAEKLIENFGEELVYKEITKGAYNPATGTSADSTVESNIFAVKMDYKSGEINGTTILNGDVKLLVKGNGFKIDSYFEISNEDYRIVSINELKPGDTSIITEIQVRK